MPDKVKESKAVLLAAKLSADRNDFFAHNKPPLL